MGANIIFNNYGKKQTAAGNKNILGTPVFDKINSVYFL